MKKFIKELWGLTYLTIKCNFMRIVIIAYCTFVVTSMIKLVSIVKMEEKVYKYYADTLEMR